MAQGRRRGAANGTGRAVPADPDRIIDALVSLVEANGWRSVSLAAVAEAAGLPILQVYRLFPSRTAILDGLLRRIDERVLAAPLDAEADEKPRDRVFDLLMRRFDALQPYRGFIAALRRDLPGDPPAAGGRRDRVQRDRRNCRGQADRRVIPRCSAHMVARRVARPRADHGDARPPVARNRAVAEAGIAALSRRRG